MTLTQAKALSVGSEFISHFSDMPRLAYRVIYKDSKGFRLVDQRGIEVWVSFADKTHRPFFSNSAQ